jgi:hypothetical protein
MNKLVAFAFVAALGFTALSAAQAMPIVPPASPAEGIVLPVAGGCGPGFHRGPRGGCLRNYARPALHACPRGYHVGPGGRCRGNY